jgi:hypothetical protein
MRNTNGVTRMALMLLLLLVSGGAAVAQETTRILTWNIHGSKFCPPSRPKCASQGMRTNSELDQIIKVIKESNAGTINLQEVYRPQADYIARKVRGSAEGCFEDRGIRNVEHVTSHVRNPIHCYFVAEKEYGAHPDYGDAVISFRDIIQTTARRIHTQHDPKITNCKTKGDVHDELCDGTFAKLTGVTIKAGNRLLRAYTAHLTANPSNPAEHERQVSWQVSNILEVIRKDKAHADGVYRAVLTGDFNFVPPANVNNPPPGPYKNLREKFEDAWVKGNPCQRDPGPGPVCGATEPAPTTEHPGNRVSRRIDYVFLYKGSGFNLTDIKLLWKEPCKGGGGPCLSDHLPISATISF